MRLWIGRSETHGWLGRRVYRLSIGLDADAVEREVIARHRLDRAEVWVSPAALQLEAAAESAFERAAAATGWSWAATRRALALNLEGLRHARAGGLEARVTVADLITGTTLEADEVSELTAAEAGIANGFAGLAARVAALVAFEDGEEVVVEPPAEDQGVPPARWVRGGRS